MVADPSRPGRDPEIAIDLDVDGAHPPAPPPPRPRIPNAAFAFAAAIIMLAAAVVAAAKLVPPAETTAERTVRDFLEAVLAGDVQAALELTVRPDLEHELLTPEALDTRWKIVEITQVDFVRVGEEHTRAEVHVVIEAYDGTRAGDWFDVVDRDGRIRIADALSSADYLLNGFHYLELNGITVDEPTQPYARLLPGLYTSFESMPSTLDLASEPMLILGDQYAYLDPDDENEVPVPYPRPSEEGLAQVNELVREHLDACEDDPDRDGCAFALPPDPELTAALDADASWEIAAYPTIAVERFSYTVADAKVIFALVTSSPGEVRVDAALTDGSGTRETTLSCAIWMEDWSAVFHFDGRVRVTPRTGADETCRSVVEAG